MMSFIKKILGLTKENANQAIQNAIAEDNVTKAYEILTSGAIDVNMKIYYTGVEYFDSHDYYEVTCTTCLLEKAKSEPMRRLLKHFGALPLKELEKRWKSEDEAKKQKRMEQEEKRRQKEKQQLEQKAEKDNCFLDEVLR